MSDGYPSSDPVLPRSCVGWLDAFLGLGVIAAFYFAFRFNLDLTMPMFSIVLILGLSVFLGILEIARAPWRKAPPSSEPFSAILCRSGFKILGFFATLAAIGFLYWLFPEYRRPYYEPYFEAVALLFPVIPPLFVAYFIFAEWRFPEPRDGNWQMAMFVLGRWREINWEKLRQHALGWLVKGFFLAIMFGDLAYELPVFRFAQWNMSSLTFKHAFDALFAAILGVELVFVTAGYIFSSRLFNSQIRVTEDTLLGWTAALVCYGPFLNIFFKNYLGYRQGQEWNGWLANHPTLFVIWGSLILLFMFIHMWCDACFGLRFSNLTNRGIITNGCYRFCKHPAYIIKNLRWWMVSVPFIAGGIEGLRLSLLLVGVNLLYALRCYAEEKLLSRDPTYQAYGLWMDKHGWFSLVGNTFPFLKYESRLNYWRKKGLLKPLPQ